MRDLRALTLAAAPAQRWLSDDRTAVRLADLAGGGCIAGGAGALRGACLLLSSEAQLPSVLAAIELDGIARRMLLCPADLAPAHLRSIVEEAEVDVIVTDGTGPAAAGGLDLPVIACAHGPATGPASDAPRDIATEWVLFTSGTTGRPKMVLHTLASLTGPLDGPVHTADESRPVWSTFYDVRRYGGLQILLRALLGGGSMVLSSAQESIGDFLARVTARQVSHISGTPSHWRRALMSPALRGFNPSYVRLSGEAADQTILDRLHEAFPTAGLAHAFASTEAGVAFDVRDGLAGFPVAYVEQHDGPADMRVIDGVLAIRSNRTAARYLGTAGKVLADEDGFVSTGDMLERQCDRYIFVGRREGVINVGGQKVYPEEVEAVINQHPQVRMSRVRARKSPITGAIVAAEIVLRADVAQADDRFAPIRAEIVEACRVRLDAYKVPVSLKLVASIDISAAGKMVRPHA